MSLARHLMPCLSENPWASSVISRVQHHPIGLCIKHKAINRKNISRKNFSLSFFMKVAVLLLQAEFCFPIIVQSLSWLPHQQVFPVLSPFLLPSFLLFPPLPFSFYLLPSSKNKKGCLENKYLLTFSRSISAKNTPTLQRKNPQTPRKIFLRNVETTNS